MTCQWLPPYPCLWAAVNLRPAAGYLAERAPLRGGGQILPPPPAQIAKCAPSETGWVAIESSQRVLFKYFKSLKKVTSQVKVTSKLKIVTFRPIGYWKGNNDSCNPTHCQMTCQEMKKAAYKYRPFTKHRSSSLGQIRPTNQNVAWVSFNTCFMGHLRLTIRWLQLFSHLTREKDNVISNKVKF